MSAELEKARGYEEKQEISKEERPVFHMTPRIGWCNDPNGFSVYQGEYHLFYQYHPYSTQWGPMHWGHCRSRDLLRWEYLPAALAPDEDYDRDGCFSGSAAVTEDGRHLLMYTGVQKVYQEDGSAQTLQRQCVAVGDGLNYVKSAANPVITEDQLPGSPLDFRDPKIWKDGNTWYAVVANRTSDGSGAILLYKSTDIQHWMLAGTVDRSANQIGKMWECPDFFTLDGQGVLVISPQEVKLEDRAYREGNEVICLIGSVTGEASSFVRRSMEPVDQGLDFYAPQTLESPDGRRIMIGWMQAWETSKFVPEGQKWFGMMSLPRELRIRDGKLFQNPVRELDACRKNPVEYRNIHMTGTQTLSGIKGRILDMIVTVRPEEGEKYRSFTVRLAQSGRYYTSLCYDQERRELTLDRTHAGLDHGMMDRRTVPVTGEQEELKLRLILDRFSVEAFVNDGRQVLSAVIYTPQEADGISFDVDGACRLDVEKYDLEG